MQCLPLNELTCSFRPGSTQLNKNNGPDCSYYLTKGYYSGNVETHGQRHGRKKSNYKVIQPFSLFCLCNKRISPECHLSKQCVKLIQYLITVIIVSCHLSLSFSKQIHCCIFILDVKYEYGCANWFQHLRTGKIYIT